MASLSKYERIGTVNFEENITFSWKKIGEILPYLYCYPKQKYTNLFTPKIFLIFFA